VADDDDPKKTQAYEPREAEHKSAEPYNVGRSLAELADQIGSLVQEIETDRDAQSSERQQDRYWQRGLAIATTIIAVLTLAVLVRTCSV
jgi:hypothetical protein